MPVTVQEVSRGPWEKPLTPKAAADLADFRGGTMTAAAPPESAAEGERGPRGRRRPAVAVATGILLSRLAGLVRERVFAHYFGAAGAADAFSAAFRIPNLLQNLFGEGALSASFIPVYARLLARGERADAGRVAGAVLALLSLAVSLLVLVGVLATPLVIDLIAPGFTGERRALTIVLVRVFFPSTGLLVLSAWCLGVLNSHGRFLLSYAAPVVWNAVIIATLLYYGGAGHQRPDQLALTVAWGSVLASALQFAVQLPVVLSLARDLRVRLDIRSAEVRAVVRNFGPVFVGRGVVQLSAYVDQILSTLLPLGSVALIRYAQNLSVLPISLFGMSVSAAELPAMSGLHGSEAEVSAMLRARLDAGLGRIAFFVVPSAMAFLALGDVVAGLIYRTGRFTAGDTRWVWAILAGSAVGLLASTLGRLYSSAYYALRDTRTPLRYAVIRVTLTVVLGYACALPLPRAIGIDPKWGMAGLTASAGVAGWVEFALLRRTLGARIGPTGIRLSRVASLWVASALAAATGWLVRGVIPPGHPVLLGAAVLPAYGIVYLAATAALGIPPARELVRAAARRMR